MFRVLSIPLEGSCAPHWQLPGFHLEQASSEAEGLERLTQQAFDAVLVLAPGSGGDAATLGEKLEEVCGTDIVPLVLVGDGHHPASSEPLLSLSFDAFLDAGWDPLLIERCLALAIHRVRSDRGVAEVQRQVLRAVREEVAQLKDQSIRDEQTGLFNPRYLREVLAREQPRCERQGRPYALVCFHLEGHAALLERHGAEVGLRAPARVAVALSATLRRSDYAFRLGDASFATLLLGAGREEAQAYAQRIRGALSRCALSVQGVQVPLAVSAGLAVFPEDGSGVDGLLEVAETAARGVPAGEESAA